MYPHALLMMAVLPAAAIDRPSTLPAGTVQLDVGFGVHDARVLGVDLPAEASFPLGVTWGAGERLQLGVSTTLDVAPDARWPGDASFGLAWRAWAHDDVDLTPTFTLPITTRAGYDVVSVATIGAGLRWRASRRVELHALRGLWRVDIRPYVALSAVADGGVLVQVAPCVAVDVSTELARWTLVGQYAVDTTFIDGLPVAVGVLWALRPRFDLRAAARVDDVAAPGDGFGLSVGLSSRW